MRRCAPVTKSKNLLPTSLGNPQNLKTPLRKTTSTRAIRGVVMRGHAVPSRDDAPRLFGIRIPPHRAWHSHVARACNPRVCVYASGTPPSHGLPSPCEVPSHTDPLDHL